MTDPRGEAPSEVTTKRELLARVVKELSLDTSDPFTLIFANACALSDLCEELRRENASLRSAKQAKPVCYGILDSNGKMLWSENCIFANEGDAVDELHHLLQDDPDAGWRLVPFYAATLPEAPQPAIAANVDLHHDFDLERISLALVEAVDAEFARNEVLRVVGAHDKDFRLRTIAAVNQRMLEGWIELVIKPLVAKYDRHIQSLQRIVEREESLRSETAPSGTAKVPEGQNAAGQEELDGSQPDRASPSPASAVPLEKYGPCSICGFSDWPKDCPGRNNDDGTTCAYIDQLQEVAAREALSAAYWKDKAAEQERMYAEVSKALEELAAQVFAGSATAPLATEQRARGLTPEMVVAHYPQTQHQPDECELCHYVFKIAAEALAATALHWVYAAAQAHFRLIMELQDASVEPTGGAHLVWMLEQIKPEKMSPTKACRWLGWIQAVLCERGAASLEELKAVNKAAADKVAKREGP